MDGLLLPMILLVGADKPNQKALFKQILPALLPGSSTQRLVVATISAKKQIKIQAETEKDLVRDAIRAGRFGSAADLADFPALDAAFKRLPPAVQSSIPFPGTPTGGGRRSGGDET
jgi:hypothetical protein